MATDFRISVSGCSIGEDFSFYFDDGRGIKLLDRNFQCELLTQLPNTAVAAVACRASDQVCASAPVAITPQALSAAQLETLVQTWPQLPFQELTRRAAAYLPALNALPPGKERTRIKAEVVRLLGTALDEETLKSRPLTFQVFVH